MTITPRTDVRLLQCPLEISEDNQLTFANSTAQYNYFNSLTKLDLENNFTYQRKDQVVRVPYQVDQLWHFNYVMYQNSAYTNKWFYAYITNLEYVNDGCTDVYIKTDVFQTWQFDLSYYPTFVEREHTNNDAIGANTIPEGLELGDIVQNTQCMKFDNLNKIIVFQVSEVIDALNCPGDVNRYGLDYGGVFGGLMLFYVDDYGAAQNVIYHYDKSGKRDAIQSIFMAPLQASPGSVRSSTTAEGKTIHWINHSAYSTRFGTVACPRPTQLGRMDGDKYTPKNNKLFTYPYCYIYGTNNVGQSTTYRYEDFANNTPRFDALAVLGQGCSIYARPRNNYKGAPITDEEGAMYSQGQGVYDYGLVFPKYPLCGWASDFYLNWQTQNAINMPLQAAEEGVGAIGSMMSGDLGGMVSGVERMITNAVSQVYSAQLVPNIAKGNANCSDVNWASQMRGVNYTGMSIKAEYARIIDDYFSMYGYKTNRVKIPNITGRQNWNYVKTIGCYIDGHIPQNDLAEIKTMFDNGVSFWHNPATFRDYNATNNII